MELPIDPARFGAYLAVTGVMVAAPGPANLFAIAVGARRGGAGVAPAVAGMNLANVVWYAAAGVGLGGLALAFPHAFRFLAWIGAAYLAWLGVCSLRDAVRGDGALRTAQVGAGRPSLREGFLVQISNPKALLFITVVLPPFLDPARPMAPQLLLLAGVGVALDVVAMSVYGLAGAAISRRMREPAFRRAFAAFTGLLLICTGVLVALGG